MFQTTKKAANYFIALQYAQHADNDADTSAGAGVGGDGETVAVAASQVADVGFKKCKKNVFEQASFNKSCFKQ